MSKIVIRDVRDAGAGQKICTVVVPEGWFVPAGTYESFGVDVNDSHGLGPVVRALIEAGAFEGEIAPFVPEAAPTPE